MQENNSYTCKNILDAIKKHYKLKTYSALAQFLGIKEGNIYSWNARNSIGDLSVVLDKCKGISREWLTTGQGQMFDINSEAVTPTVNETPPEYFSSPDKYYLWSLINRMTDEEAEELVRVIVARKKDRGPT